MLLFVAASTLVSPQAVGGFCFFLVTLGCLIFGYCGAVWMSHFVFLSFLGGLLVIFLYAVALAPSPLFLSMWKTIKGPLKWVMGLFLMLVGFIYFSNRSVCLSCLCTGYYEVPFFSSPEFMSSSWVGGFSFLFLAVLLAICMVSVTKLCSYNKKGSLRGVRSTMS
uniref:NADH dehydrogenase subunit 6 n=1 Tax=Azumapecten farreri TaxID=106299 RepID=B4YYE7_AZUFA|nr:NADH dehydrogenase subunit 6 [Azumapecten farreri]ABQ96654.1 NADH dehydrogenase subunit 6 [Azumapecten farreri]ACD77261.1 NADH dehydrogenase subunit 6 [Azumapecten farreri]ACL36016.1 NADH dehydrogenase subunit 6 [Azumapecten farreri]